MERKIRVWLSFGPLLCCQWECPIIIPDSTFSGAVMFYFNPASAEILEEQGHQPCCWCSVASFIEEVNLRSAKCPLKTYGHCANLELTSLVKEATGQWDECWAIIENANIFSYFLNEINHGKQALTTPSKILLPSELILPSPKFRLPQPYLMLKN